jgi:hypothetical protein
MLHPNLSNVKPITSAAVSIRHPADFQMSILQRFGSCIFAADACILGGRKLSCWRLTTPALLSTITPLEMASEARQDEEFDSRSPVDNSEHAS